MLQSVLRKWLKGLRSGEYMKGKNQLVITANEMDEDGVTQTYDRFCCLGVLCDVMGYEMTDGGASGDYNGWSGTLPDAITEKLGLDKATQDVLATLNDNGVSAVVKHKKTGKISGCVPWGDEEDDYDFITLRAKTFKGIAQAIERMFI